MASGGLFRLEDAVEIAQKELCDLESIKISADLSKKEKIIQLRKEKKDPTFRINKLKQEIGKGDFE